MAHVSALNSVLGTTENDKKSRAVQCSICFATLSQAKFLRTHMRTVHGKASRRKKAEHCAKQVSLLLDLIGLTNRWVQA